MAEELRFPSSPSQRIFLVMVLPMRPLSRILLGDEWDFIFQESLWMYVHACVCVCMCVCLGPITHLLPCQLLSLDMLKTLISWLSRSPQLSASVCILTLQVLLVKLLQTSSPPMTPLSPVSSH